MDLEMGWWDHDIGAHAACWLVRKTKKRRSVGVHVPCSYPCSIIHALALAILSLSVCQADQADQADQERPKQLSGSGPCVTMPPQENQFDFEQTVSG
jgi:hypothetical protein